MKIQYDYYIFILLVSLRRESTNLKEILPCYMGDNTEHRHENQTKDTIME